MTAPTVHGRFEPDGSGVGTLIVTRDVALPVADLWRWVTDPQLTARWYGAWAVADAGTPTATGTESGTASGTAAAVGSIIDVTMAAEEGSPTMKMRVTRCEAPHVLGLESMAPAPWNWPLELECRAATEIGGEGSTITLRHLGLGEDQPLGDIGAGWEFYLDALVAAIEGREGAPFDQWRAAVAPAYDAMR